MCLRSGWWVVVVVLGAVVEYISDASALPVINQRVQIQLNIDDDIDQAVTGEPSRIEDVLVVGGKKPVQEVVLAAPRYTGDIEAPSPGHPMAIVWSTDRGVLELPVEFVGLERAGEVASAWRVRVTGPAARVQRRHFVRVPFVTPVVLTLLEPDLEPEAGVEPEACVEPEAGSDPAELATVSPVVSPIVCATADLSEGGLRCLLDCELPEDTKVIAVFAFGEDEFRLEARIVRSFPLSGRVGRALPPKWDTGVRFVDPDLSGDVLRKNIFAEQMRLRRSNGR